MTTEAWFRCGRLHHFPICLTGLDFFLLLSAFDVLLSFVSYADFHKRSANNKVFSFCAFFFFSFLVTIFLFPGYCKAFVLKKKRKKGTPTLTKENAVYSGGVGHTVGGGNLE